MTRALPTDLGVSVASVENRLTPEHPHPEPLEDRFAALAAQPRGGVRA